MAAISALIAFTLAFIWGNSFLSAQDSSETSGAVYGTIQSVLDAVFGTGAITLTHGFIRKAAHFTEFAALGAELSLLVLVVKRESFKGYALSLACGLFVAAVDEGFQNLSDRAPSFIDVAIDFSGYLAAVAAFFAAFLLRRAKNAEKTEQNLKG